MPKQMQETTRMVINRFILKTHLFKEAGPAKLILFQTPGKPILLKKPEHETNSCRTHFPTINPFLKGMQWRVGT